jgi:hypothetical protein
MERGVALTNFNYFLLQTMGYVLFVYNLVVGTINARRFTKNCSPLYDAKLHVTQALIGEFIIDLCILCTHK